MIWRGRELRGYSGTATSSEWDPAQESIRQRTARWSRGRPRSRWIEGLQDEMASRGRSDSREQAGSRLVEGGFNVVGELFKF